MKDLEHLIVCQTENIQSLAGVEAGAGNALEKKTTRLAWVVRGLQILGIDIL